MTKAMGDRQKVKPYFVKIPKDLLVRLPQKIPGRSVYDPDIFNKVLALVLIKMNPGGKGHHSHHNQVVDWLHFYYPQWNQGVDTPANTDKEFNYFKRGITSFFKDE